MDNFFRLCVPKDVFSRALFRISVSRIMCYTIIVLALTTVKNTCNHNPQSRHTLNFSYASYTKGTFTTKSPVRVRRFNRIFAYGLQCDFVRNVERNGKLLVRERGKKLTRPKDGYLEAIFSLELI